VRRVLVFGLALLFIAGLAALTLIATTETGFSLESVVSVLILVLLSVGILGALRNPPR
jgi:hypothetical protein